MLRQVKISYYVGLTELRVVIIMTFPLKPHWFLEVLFFACKEAFSPFTNDIYTLQQSKQIWDMLLLLLLHHSRVWNLFEHPHWSPGYLLSEDLQDVIHQALVLVNV